MKIVITVIFILAILFFQIGISSHLSILGIYPNLILLTILSISILKGWKNSLIWIILGGLFIDFYSLHNYLGVSVIMILIVAYLAYFLSQNIFKKTTISSVFLVFLIAVFFSKLFLIIFYRIFDISSDFGFLEFIIEIFYNVMVGLPIFYLIKKYGR